MPKCERNENYLKANNLNVSYNWTINEKQNG